MSEFATNWEVLRFLNGEFWTGRERVALGGLSKLNGQAVWWELDNIAEHPDHEFAVDGFEVAEVLRDSVKTAVTPSVLWHSHRAQERPSRFDIEHFPHWLMVGVVWSSTSGTLCTYDRNGFISSSKAASDRVTSTIDEAENELIKAGVRPQDAHNVALKVIDQFGLY
jgi:hypothetical protein